MMDSFFILFSREISIKRCCRVMTLSMLLLHKRRKEILQFSPSCKLFVFYTSLHISIFYTPICIYCILVRVFQLVLNRYFKKIMEKISYSLLFNAILFFFFFGTLGKPLKILNGRLLLNY